jgi:NADH-quinone oxidoreductase subunit L
LAGLPPLAGFFSKDEILAEAFILNFPVYILLAIAAFFTAFYMGRQIWMVFFGTPRHEAADHAEESPLVITIPLIALAALSILGGALNLPWVHSFTHWLEHTYESFHLHLHAGEFNMQIALISTGLAILAILISWLLYGRNPLKKNQNDPLQKGLGPIFTGMNRKWFVDEIYEVLFINRYIDLAKFLSIKVDWDFWHDWFHDQVIGRIYHQGSRILAEPIDLGIIDGVSKGLARLFDYLSQQSRKLQTGFVRNYALAVFAGVVILLGYLLLA